MLVSFNRVSLLVLIPKRTGMMSYKLKVSLPYKPLGGSYRSSTQYEVETVTVTVFDSLHAVTRLAAVQAGAQAAAAIWKPNSWFNCSTLFCS